MKQYFVVLKDQQGVPDFIHPTDIMGESAQQIRSIMSENTPPEYIQGVYTAQEYLQFIQSKQFGNLLASYNPQFSNPQAVKNVVAQLVGYVQSFMEPSQEMGDMAQLVGGTGSGSLTEENFDYDEHTAPAGPERVIYPHPANVRDGNVTTDPFGTAPKDPRQLKKAEVKYFTESGIKFKLENGQLYKKEWTDTPIEPYMDKVTDPKTGEEKEVEIIPDFRLVNKETGKPVKLSKYLLQQAVWKKLES